MAASPAYLELLLEWGVNSGTPTRPTTFFIAFNTADPGTTGANEATELPRTAVTNWNAGSPNDGQVENTDAGETATGATGSVTVTDFSVWSASTGGTYYFGDSLTAPQALVSGDKLSWASGAITATIS